MSPSEQPSNVGSRASPSNRTLSKSDFKLARTCRAKLYFRENGYPDSRESDPYQKLLAEGGYMVEALAKAKYADGIQLEYGTNPPADFARSLEHLRRDNVTLFEGTLLAGRRQARVDVLEKKGNVVRLIEVKAKSFDGEEHFADLRDGGLGVFRTKRKPHAVSSDWREKIEDITYQVLLLEKVLPGVTIHPFLALVDKSKNAALDNIPRFFELVRRSGRDGVTRLYTARYNGTRNDLASLDLITEVDVSAEVATLREEVEEAAAAFEAHLDASLDVYLGGLERGSKCIKCEFRHDPPEAKDGFVECWGPLAATKPHILELYSIGKARGPDRTPLIDWMLKAGTTSLIDIPEEGLVTADGEVGKDATRQRRQIRHTRTRETYVGSELRTKIEAVRVPLYFIDFETSRLALPYHTRMRPYGVVTFQWSCHTLASPGQPPIHSDWLNSEEPWPNQLFAESLRRAIGDTGAVLTWSPFENATLRQIVADLAEFGRQEPDLVAWMNSIESRIVDLHTWARDDYYHPMMKGRTSIKVVLDALWKTDPAMREQFVAYTGIRAEGSQDPYASLPPALINGVPQNVHEGTGAMRAYQEMMYGADRGDAAVKAAWSGLLRQYCSLDTLSMVLIFEHWRRLTGLA